MKKHPLSAFLILTALLSGAFIGGILLTGEKGYYLAGPYMFVPALAALITRLFFYRPKFTDAHLGFGKIRNYLKFWLITIAVVLFSYLLYTFLGAVSWDFSGNTFLDQFSDQMALSGQSIDDLPEGFTPRMMLLLFFLGGLTLFNIPMTVMGFGEEFGWRGFLFPLLCRKHLIPGLILGGLIWFAWHIPLQFVLPAPVEAGAGEKVLGYFALGIGSIFSFTFFAYIYAKTGTIWAASFVHAVFNNASRSFSYFVKVEDYFLANLGITITMGAVIVFLYFRGELKVIKSFLAEGVRNITD